MADKFNSVKCCRTGCTADAWRVMVAWNHVQRPICREHLVEAVDDLPSAVFVLKHVEQEGDDKCA